MSLVDVHAIDNFEALLGVDDADWFVDGDNVLFRYGTTELLPHAREFLDLVDHDRLAIASANPNTYLKAARNDIIRPKLYLTPRAGSLPPWSKHNLYKRAGEMMTKGEGKHNVGIVVDDRWLMGAVVGKYALDNVGYECSIAAFLDRGIAPNNPFDKGLAIIQQAGLYVARATGLDELIRPRS